MFLDLSSKGPNFRVLFLYNRVEALAFLSKNLDLIFALGSESLDAAFVVTYFLSGFIKFSAHIFEFILQFAKLAG